MWVGIIWSDLDEVRWVGMMCGETRWVGIMWCDLGEVRWVGMMWG